ncbi:MAG: hypothetical protein LQ341_000468 [Variospora aurantia]|nr:MAG: hypothetical protein LQ341_000468 [Variospora aurantia]
MHICRLAQLIVLTASHSPWPRVTLFVLRQSKNEVIHEHNDVVFDWMTYISTSDSVPSSTSFVRFLKIAFRAGVQVASPQSFVFCALDTRKLCPTDAESPASPTGSFR